MENNIPTNLHQRPNPPETGVPEVSKPGLGRSEKGADTQQINRVRKIYEEAFPTLKEGEIVKGKIIRCTEDSVFIDLGLKSEAVVPINEFSPTDVLSEGNDVLVYLEALEGIDGLPIISKKKADALIAWTEIENKAQSQDIITAKVIKKVTGGLLVEVFGQEAFLPGSQIELKPVYNPDEYIGKLLEVKIISVNPKKRNIVVSRRKILEEKLDEARRRVFSTIKVGDIVEGTVTNLTDFGAFVDIDGVPALLHISDMSWDRITNPAEVLKKGDHIKIKVLTVNPENYRITVGLKQLTKHPWEEIEQRYPIGSKVKGKVTTIAEYGVLVELEKNLEGFIHTSELSWNKSIQHPSQLLKVGDEVEAMVLAVDRELRRISLGLKQTTPDPWSTIEERFQIGEKITGRITALKPFGAFVEIEPGIEGLIRNNDLSWTKRVRHPGEIVKKNQKIEAIILDIDKENRQIALGLKQTKEDPFYRLSKEYKPGDQISARIVDISKTGIIVNLPYGIEGYVPKTQLIEKLGKKDSKYQIGNSLDLKITRIDFENRRIGLSEKALAILEEVATDREVPSEEAVQSLVTEKTSRRRPKEEDFPKRDEVKFTFEDHLPPDDLELKLRKKRKSKHKKEENSTKTSEFEEMN
ncbi:MAG: 30S ribosomal protein S1 [candidate division WOR-3 bacterium]|nr:30S ribosomal protein S1 [candidate division WOR-3 bacterium]